MKLLFILIFFLVVPYKALTINNVTASKLKVKRDDDETVKPYYVEECQYINKDLLEKSKNFECCGSFEGKIECNEEG